MYSRALQYQALRGLLLLMFMLRAAIPAGYMPVHAPDRPGALSMSLCVSGLSTTVIQLLALDHGNGHTPQPHELDCVFGAVAGPGDILVGGPAPAYILALVVRYLMVWAPAPVVFAADVRGPPLGPRAPPEQLVSQLSLQSNRIV